MEGSELSRDEGIRPRPWRYFPELLRDLHHTSGHGDPCPLCEAETQTLEGPRARLTWCPECFLLAVHDGSRTRGPAYLGPMGAGTPPTAELPGFGPGARLQ